MPSGTTTWRRALERKKALLEFVRKKGLADFREIYEHIARMGQISERAVHYYLYELCQYGVLRFNEKTLQYEPNIIRRHYTLKEHRLTLQHSKKLLFSDEDTQRFDHMTPDVAQGILVSVMARTEGLAEGLEGRLSPLYPDPNLKLLIQHIKTGYPAWCWAIIQLIEEMRKNPTVAQREPIPPRESILNPLYHVMELVEHGVPLEGYCEACPGRHLSSMEDPRKKR